MESTGRGGSCYSRVLLHCDSPYSMLSAFAHGNITQSSLCSRAVVLMKVVTLHSLAYKRFMVGAHLYVQNSVAPNITKAKLSMIYDLHAVMHLHIESA